MMTIAQASKKWACSYSLVVKWIKQGRLQVTKPGRDIFVLDTERPAKAKPGSLSPGQRRVWKK